MASEPLHKKREAAYTVKEKRGNIWQSFLDVNG